jgi:hypothetical protein
MANPECSVAERRLAARQQNRSDNIDKSAPPSGPALHNPGKFSGLLGAAF